MILFYSFIAPPKNGVTFVTSEVIKQIEGKNIPVVQVPLNSKYTGRFTRKIGRIFHSFKVVLFTLLNSSRSKVIYMTPSGGLGIIFETLILLLISLRGIGVNANPNKDTNTTLRK